MLKSRRIVLLAALATVVIAATGCSTNPSKVVAQVETAAAKHTGPWTDEDLRKAAGEYMDDVERTEAWETGGIVVVELGSSGGTKSKSKNGTSRRSDYEVECLELTIDEKTVTSRTYERTDAYHRPDC